MSVGVGGCWGVGGVLLLRQGRSSSFFCHSADNAFIMKTVSPKEALSLLEMLPKYLQYLRCAVVPPGPLAPATPTRCHRPRVLHVPAPVMQPCAHVVP